MGQEQQSPSCRCLSFSSFVCCAKGNETLRWITWMHWTVAGGRRGGSHRRSALVELAGVRVRCPRSIASLSSSSSALPAAAYPGGSAQRGIRATPKVNGRPRLTRPSPATHPPVPGTQRLRCGCIPVATMLLPYRGDAHLLRGLFPVRLEHRGGERPLLLVALGGRVEQRGDGHARVDVERPPALLRVEELDPAVQGGSAGTEVRAAAGGKGVVTAVSACARQGGLGSTSIWG